MVRESNHSLNKNMSESLPFTWAKTDQDIGTEAQYAKISDDLNDIAIKWGAEIQGEPDKRVFQSKRFGGMGLEVSIYTKKSLDNQTVFIHRGTNTGGFQPLKRGGDNDTMIPLKARVAQEQTPGGISYPVQKQQGLLVVDKEFSIEDVLSIIGIIDNVARRRGLFGSNGERISHPELIKLKKDKYKVSEVFKDQGARMPVLPGMSVFEAINEFDKPNELIVRTDPWGGENAYLVKKKDISYLDQYDQTLNDILIERGLTMGELHQGLEVDMKTFAPLAIAIGEEVKKRMVLEKKE